MPPRIFCNTVMIVAPFLKKWNLTRQSQTTAGIYSLFIFFCPWTVLKMIESVYDFFFSPQFVLPLSIWCSSVQHTKRSKINTLEEWLEGLYLLPRMIWLRELFISGKLWPVPVSTEDRNNSFFLSLLILEAAVMQFLTFSA